jgi:hypothetical protein
MAKPVSPRQLAPGDFVSAGLLPLQVQFPVVYKTSNLVQISFEHTALEEFLEPPLDYLGDATTYVSRHGSLQKRQKDSADVEQLIRTLVAHLDGLTSGSIPEGLHFDG